MLQPINQIYISNDDATKTYENILKKFSGIYNVSLPETKVEIKVYNLLKSMDY